MNYDLINFAVFVWIQPFIMFYEYLIKNLLSSWFAVRLLVDPLLCSKSNDTVGIKSFEIGKKVLHLFDNVFHVYLMNGLQKYKKKKFFTVAF